MAIAYGFATKLTAGQSSTFGHTAYSGSNLAVFGCNAPKPARARDLADNTVSFVDKSVDLSATGLLRVGRGKSSPIARTTTKAVLMEVPFYGVSYLWYQPKEVATAIGGALASLGASAYSGTNGVLGINRIRGGAAGEDGVAKPDRAVLMKVGGTDGIDMVSTFVRTPFTGALPDGWTLVPSKN
jgi:hypothetical protein